MSAAIRRARRRQPLAGLLKRTPPSRLGRLILRGLLDAAHTGSHRPPQKPRRVVNQEPAVRDDAAAGDEIAHI